MNVSVCDRILSPEKYSSNHFPGTRRIIKFSKEIRYGKLKTYINFFQTYVSVPKGLCAVLITASQ